MRKQLFQSAPVKPATKNPKRGPAKGQGGRPLKRAEEKSPRVKLTVRILPETLANIRAKGESAAQVLDAFFSA